MNHERAGALVDETHDPSLRSWVASANTRETDFPIQNLPLGVFTRRGTQQAPRIGVAIGAEVLDLPLAAKSLGSLPVEIREALVRPALNGLMALGHDAMRKLRRALVVLLREGSPHADPGLLVPIASVEMHLPAAIGDYTDFYASIHHATRVGSLFRPDNPLLPNYKHVPIAYHGRSSSIVPSGTVVRRPSGQTKSPNEAQPAYRPSRALDYELEAGIFIGRGNGLGQPVDITNAEEHVFGLCLLNDWSARDIQSWEYQPLGPFLAKNFATTISPWVVTMEALAPFRRAPMPRAEGDPGPLAYLRNDKDAATAFDVNVEAWLTTAQMSERGIDPYRLSAASTRDLYWNVAQMVAHHTSNGCNLRPGDLLGTGTISGPDDSSRGCLMEITSNGGKSIVLPSGEKRTFLADGDEVILRGFCTREGFARIGFGECTGIVRSS
jgi:fumarylacetoacetase